MDKKIILKQEHKATGTKVFLSCMENSHIRHLIKIAQDPSLIEAMGWDTFFELHQTEQFIEAISSYALPYSQESQPLVFGIYLEPEGMPIGYAVLKGMNMELLTAEVGLAILDPKYRPKGYGRLALSCIVNYAQDELHIQTIGAAILLSNKRSVNMCKKVGFVVREILPQSWTMPDGTVADMAWMELTRETSSL